MLLVIARKFNDIFYAMSLPQWTLAHSRHLIIISNGLNKDDFPLQFAFDDVKFISYSGESIINIIKTLWKISKIEIGKIDTIVLSNPVLVTNQYIIKKSRPKNIILIEDGSLNYSSFSPSRSFVKKSLQILLGINQDKIFNNIDSTYLFYPSKGKFFFGQLQRLVFDRRIFSSVSFPINLNGKKIFVGQPLYNYGYITRQDYTILVNKVIEKYHIDFYLPHAFSSDLEEINSKSLNIAKYNVTLEALASQYKFSIFSFGSSVLYTCKTINPDIESNLILLPKKSTKVYDISFIQSFCNHTYDN